MTRQTLIHFYQRHRWFMSALFLAMAWGFYVDLKPLFDQGQDLIEQERNLLQQWEEKEKALQQAGPLANRLGLLPPPMARKPLLDQIIQAAEGKVFKLTSLQTEVQNSESRGKELESKTSLPSRLLIKLRFEGDFFGFYRFIEALLKEGLPLRLDHFTLKDQGESLDLVLQFSAYPWLEGMVGGALKAASDLSPVACCARDPFREPALLFSEMSALGQEELENFSLDQIRYVGYLAQEGKTSALLLLPKGRIYDIYPGSRLCKEQLRVLSIAPKSLTLLDPRQAKLLRVQRT